MLQEMAVEDERCMQRSMLDALLAGGDGAAKAGPQQATTVTAADAPAAAAAAAGAALGAQVAAAAKAATAQPSQRGAAQPQAQWQPAAAAEDGPTTVFLRNLPSGTTEPELRSVLSKFGPLKACRCAASILLETVQAAETSSTPKPLRPPRRL